VVDPAGIDPVLVAEVAPALAAGHLLAAQAVRGAEGFGSGNSGAPLYALDDAGGSALAGMISAMLTDKRRTVLLVTPVERFGSMVKSTRAGTLPDDFILRLQPVLWREGARDFALTRANFEDGRALALHVEGGGAARVSARLHDVATDAILWAHDFAGDASQGKASGPASYVFPELASLPDTMRLHVRYAGDARVVLTLANRPLPPAPAASAQQLIPLPGAGGYSDRFDRTDLFSPPHRLYARHYAVRAAVAGDMLIRVVFADADTAERFTPQLRVYRGDGGELIATGEDALAVSISLDAAEEVRITIELHDRAGRFAAWDPRYELILAVQ
jgi:hypothetical protein